MNVQQNNMVSTLPLLFANGYPTSLEKITEAQLENFIPFMIQCSSGQINVEGKIDWSRPEWWPQDVPYTIPLKKPKDLKGSWLNKMKEIVTACYQFYNNVFLLKFCNELSAIDPASIRFINNYNSTASLYDRRENKVLVTFRYENMSYDQPQRNKKCLLLKKYRHDADGKPQQLMVEPALFDIYLCDFCDAEFYSFEAIKEHERTCTSDNDVIICDSPSTESNPHFSSNASERPDDESRMKFLLNFELQDNSRDRKIFAKEEIEFVDDIDFKPIEKVKRLPRRNRGIYALSRCPLIPISSPAGQKLVKMSKTVMTEDYLYERLDRMERFCHAPILAPGVHRPKYLDKKYNSLNVHCTFKKPSEYPRHTYIFPRRQFRSRNRAEGFNFLNSSLLKLCRPFSISLKRYTEEELRLIIEKRKFNASGYGNRLEKMEEDKRLSQEQIIIETIDLCSSDEEESSELVKDFSICSLSQSSASSTSSSKSFVSSTATTVSSTNVMNRTANNETSKSFNRFKGNFLVSQPAKPLEPSFLFSNYSTGSPNHQHFNQFSQPTNKLPQYRSFQDQENLQMNLQKTSDDVLTFTNNNSSSNNRTDRNNSSNRILQYMPLMDSEVTINKINNSPNRIISIDLT